MTDLYALLGVPAPRPGRPARARTRCTACHRPVYVDQLVYGLGRCCAEKAGLIVVRYRFPHQHQTGETLLDHLPEEHHVDPFPTARVDVAGLDPFTAHAKIMELARAMLTPAPGLAPFPAEVVEAMTAAAQGLVDILERHAPHDDPTEVHCSEVWHSMLAWPCPDYRDAAAGFAVNLPAGREITTPAAAE